MHIHHQLMILLCFNCGSMAFAQTPIAEIEDTNQLAINELIDQLNDDRFSVRQKAETKLLELGQPGLDALRKAAESDNPELRARIQRLLKHRMLSLTKVEAVGHDKLKDVSSVTVSPDGRFVYAAAHSPAALTVFCAMKQPVASKGFKPSQTHFDLAVPSVCG